MKFYLAPLEGNTGYIFRNVIHDIYGDDIEKYFIPFIEPHTKRNFNSREWNDILPEHNAGMYAVPQILTKSAPDFLRVEKELLALGYREININLGCPSGTVVSRGRGAGMLKDPEELDHFLYEIFAHTNAEISLKTRIGISELYEFADLLSVYNKYPLKELIIHPRLQKEMYRPTIHLDAFQYAMEHSRNILCYNGDITSPHTYHRIMDRLSPVEANTIPSIMIGRGILQNPQLIATLTEAEQNPYVSEDPDLQKLKIFCDRLLEDYSRVLSGEKNILFRMKELWSHMAPQFPDKKKQLKAIKKSQSVSEYQASVCAFFL